MATRDLHLLGSPVLRQRSDEVAAVDAEVRRLITDLFETMDAAKGVGLAANQVGVARRVAVVGVDDTRIAMVNPVLVSAESRDRAEEGCLSIPDAYGEVTRPARVVLEASDEQMREAGMSRQKAGYLRSLAGLVSSGELDLANLPEDDEEAIAQLTKIKGIGRWSAEIYLLFAEGRHDVWPAGDLAVQIEIGKLMGLEGKPTEKQLRELAEKWRPHRGAAAVLAWHSYNAPPLD